MHVAVDLHNEMNPFKCSTYCSNDLSHSLYLKSLIWLACCALHLLPGALFLRQVLLQLPPLSALFCCRRVPDSHPLAEVPRQACSLGLYLCGLCLRSLEAAAASVSAISCSATTAAASRADAALSCILQVEIDFSFVVFVGQA